MAGDNRDKKGRFVAGCSGNPGGKPARLKEIRELGEQMAPHVMNRLYEIAMDPKSHPMASVAAGREILDRTYGKAAQPQLTFGIDANGLDGTDMGGLSALLMRARMSKSEQAKKIVTDADFVVKPNGQAYAAKPADEPGEASPAQAAPPPEPEPVILKRAPDPAQSEQPKPKPQPKPEAPTLKTDPKLKPQPQPSVSYARVPGTNRVKRVP